MLNNKIGGRDDKEIKKSLPPSHLRSTAPSSEGAIRLRVAEKSARLAGQQKSIYAKPVELGLCPKKKNHPLCGWILILVQYGTAAKKCKNIINKVIFHNLSLKYILQGFDILYEIMYYK